MEIQERLRNLKRLILASELEMVDAEIRIGSKHVVDALGTSERAQAIEFIEISADIAGDAKSLKTLDYLMDKVTASGYLSQAEIDSIYARPLQIGGCRIRAEQVLPPG